MIRPIEQIAWLNGQGRMQEVVISSRIRLARNLADSPFPSLGHLESLAQVEGKVAQALSNYPEFEYCSAEKLNEMQLALLTERHLVSPPFCGHHCPRGLALDGPSRLSIMVNEEDHLRIQVLVPGLEIDSGWRLADEVDDKLSRHLEFAYDSHLGFLTSCLSNVGTGLRASVMLHLPGLSWFQAIPRIVHQVQQVGLTIRGLYGEGTRPASNLFQISNQVTLGLSETEILTKVEGVATQLAKAELNARAQLVRDYRPQVEDRVWRCFGILRSARLIESVEALELLSMVRLGVDLKLLPEIHPGHLCRLLVRIRPANLQHETGRDLGPVERDLARASLLRSALHEH